MNNPSLAREGERLAAEYLVQNGLKVIEKNYRCPLGEVDIILLDNETLVFCEVKARNSLNYGYPLESITPRKLNKINKVAQYYMCGDQVDYRIDALGIYYVNGKPEIEWIKNCTI